MADVKISELPALTSPDGAEELVVNDGGTTKKVLMSNLLIKGIDNSAADATAITINSGEDVGIGIAPTSKLHIGDAAPKIQIYNSTSNDTCSINVGNGTNDGELYLTGGGSRGVNLAYNNGASVGLKLDSSGNLGLGVVPEAWFSSVDALQVASSGALFGRNNEDNRVGIASNAYETASNTWKRIGNSGSAYANLYETDNGAHKFKVAAVGAADSAISWTTGLEVLNDGKARAKNGLLFGTDTAAANTLDDYEEGNFTPSYSSAGISAITYGRQDGYYTKVGRLVTVTINIFTNGVTVTNSSSTVTIAGLPFTAANVTEGVNTVNLSMSFRFNANPPGSAYIPINGSGITILTNASAYTTANDPTYSIVSDFVTTSGNKNTIRLTATYFTD